MHTLFPLFLLAIDSSTCHDSQARVLCVLPEVTGIENVPAYVVFHRASGKGFPDTQVMQRDLGMASCYHKIFFFPPNA
jgi:hypothetical protein